MLERVLLGIGAFMQQLPAHVLSEKLPREEAYVYMTIKKQDEAREIVN